MIHIKPISCVLTSFSWMSIFLIRNSRLFHLINVSDFLSTLDACTMFINYYQLHFENLFTQLVKFWFCHQLQFKDKSLYSWKITQKFTVTHNKLLKHYTYIPFTSNQYHKSNIQKCLPNGEVYFSVFIIRTEVFSLESFIETGISYNLDVLNYLRKKNWKIFFKAQIKN